MVPNHFGITEIANVAAIAIRAAWQHGRTQKLPGNAVGKATVPAVAGTILHIPRKDQKRINQTSASLLAVLLKQAREGEDRQRTNSVRLYLWVMYGYGRLSAAKLNCENMNWQPVIVNGRLICEVDPETYRIRVKRNLTAVFNMKPSNTE